MSKSYNSLIIHGNVVTLNAWDPDGIRTGDLFQSFTIVREHVVGVGVHYSPESYINFTVSTGFGQITVEYGDDRSEEMHDDHEGLLRWLEGVTS